LARSSKDLSVPVTSTNLSGVVDKGCEFEGKLCFQGTVRINGKFKGQIYTPDTLVVGDDAVVQGEVEAGVVIVSGEFNGSIKAKYRVEVHKPGIFRGDIITPSLSVEEGVLFEGRSRMTQTDPS